MHISYYVTYIFVDEASLKALPGAVPAYLLTSASLSLQARVLFVLLVLTQLTILITFRYLPYPELKGQYPWFPLFSEDLKVSHNTLISKDTKQCKLSSLHSVRCILQMTITFSVIFILKNNSFPPQYMAIKCDLIKIWQIHNITQNGQLLI